MLIPVVKEGEMRMPVPFFHFFLPASPFLIFPVLPSFLADPARSINCDICFIIGICGKAC